MAESAAAEAMGRSVGLFTLSEAEGQAPEKQAKTRGL